MSSRKYDSNEIGTNKNDLDIKHRRSESVEFSKFINAIKHQRNSVVGEPHEYYKYRKRTSSLMPAENKHAYDSVNQAIKFRKPSFDSMSEISTKSTENSENSKNVSESDIDDSKAHKYWTYWKRPDPKAHKYWTYRNLKRKSSVKDSEIDDTRPNGSDDNIPNYALTHWTYLFLDDIISDDNNSNAHHKRNSSLNQDKDSVDAYNKLSDGKSFHYHPIENVRSPIPNLLDRNQKQKDGFVGEPHEYGRFKRSASMQDKDSVDAYNKLSDRKSFHYHPIENVRSPIPNLLDRNQKQKDGFVGEPHEYGRFKRSASMQPDNEGSEIFTPTKKMQYKNENNVNSSSKKFPTEISNNQPFINGKPLPRSGENFPRNTSIFLTPQKKL